MAVTKLLVQDRKVARLSTCGILLRLHWLLGISVGLVLAFIGVTGAMMSFEDDIMFALSPNATVAADNRVPLTPDALVASIKQNKPGFDIVFLTIEREAMLVPMVALRPVGKTGRAVRTFVDPYSGALLGDRTGAGFFYTVRQLHRWLAMPGGSSGIGGHLTGFSALCLIFFALSGLYLRWPKRPWNWRIWLKLDFRLKGRNFYRALHSVIGAWLVVFYLLSATTGLWWSYSWYQNALTYVLTGQAPAEKPSVAKTGERGEPPSLAPAWKAFLGLYGDAWQSVTITPAAPDKPVRFRVIPDGAPHDRAFDVVLINPTQGGIVSIRAYDDLTVSQTLLTNMEPLHTGSFFGLPGRIALFISSFSLPLFAVTGLLMYRSRRKGRQRTTADARHITH